VPGAMWQYSYFDPTKTEQYTDMEISATKSNYPKGISSVKLGRKKSQTKEDEIGYPELNEKPYNL